MDLKNLRDNYHKLISHMEENGYCTCYVRKIRCEINRVLSNLEAKTWTSYRDIYLEYAKKSSNPTHLRDKITFLGVIENFDVRDQYPDGTRRQKILQRGNYHKLSNEFKAVIDYYCAAEKTRGISESGIKVKAYGGSSFLFALQQKGIDMIEKITEESVLATFVSPEHGLLRGYSCKESVEAVFRACIPQNPEIFMKILAFLPALRKTRKNIQYLQPEEITRLKQVLTGEKTSLSLRDKAIGTLALYTGLRRGDIARLTLDAVDWENDRLRICQSKTGVFLELPLTAIVGNAILDYLKFERPNSECKYIFLTSKRTYRRLNDFSFSSIAEKIMKAAGIRQSIGDRKGFHIFRHHLATELLGNDISQPIISKILGHTSPNSLEVYLSADFKHLKDCAISIEHLPVRKGVLDDA